MNSVLYLLPQLTYFAVLLCINEIESIMNVEKSNFIPIRIKNYTNIDTIYIYIYIIFDDIVNLTSELHNSNARTNHLRKRKKERT